MLSIIGNRIYGLGIASSSLQIQLPLIANTFSEIANCHYGTINIELIQPLLVVAPDFRTKRIVWNTDYPDGEVFDFLRIQLEIEGKILPEPAWLYIAHDSPHRENLRIHEILAPKLNLDSTTNIKIHIDRSSTRIPYSTYQINIV